MECNRDEALRAKSIAEGKMERKDFLGAKRIALKAQALYPGLEGVTQILMTLDVYVAAENKVSGQVDWYGVLGVNPSADDEMIKKQYRKLALMLHPDKNRSVGAEGAFKLISEAWNLLSDKAKRSAYNERMGFKGFRQKVSVHSQNPEAQSRSNGIYNVGSRTTSVPEKQSNHAVAHGVKISPAKGPGVKVAPPKRDTFWTICHRCNMQYEYSKKHLNLNLLCHKCQKGFIASETNPPPKIGGGATSIPRVQKKYTEMLGTKVSAVQVPRTKVSSAKVHGAKVSAPLYSKNDDTFWTICEHCKMHYEYDKVYLNRALLCPMCQKGFMASEKAPPANFPKSSNVVPLQQSHNLNDHLPNKSSFDPGRNATVDKKTGPSTTEKSAAVVQQVQNQLKRQFTVLHTSSGKEECVKMRKLDDYRC